MKHILFLLYFLNLASGAMAASNTTLYETSFEPPAFTPGVHLRGQDDWEMYHDGEAISVATNNAHTGTQCLRFDGSLLEQNGPNHATAYCFSRALDAYSNNPPAIVELTTSVRLDGPRTGTNGTPAEDILSANFMAVVPRPDGQGELLGGFFVSSAGKIWSYSPNAADNYKHSVPYNFGTYRTLRLRIDFVARTLRYFVDGTYLGLMNFPSSITTDRLYGAYLFLNGALDPIDTPELTYRMEDYTAYFDDYNIVSVPLSPVNAVIEFASTNVLTDEFKPTASINVVRRGFTSAAVRVTVSTTNGTAIAGEDYEATSGFVTFAAGETNKIFEVPLKDNFFPQPDRTFGLEITELPPGASTGRPRVNVLIRDDERPGSIDYSWFSNYGLPPLEPNEVKFAVPLVYPFPIQADGKPIISFDVEGPNVVQYFRVVRLNTDGSLDGSFPPIESSRWITAWPMASGGIVLLEDNYPHGYLVTRRNSDGTPDRTFSATITNSSIAGVKGVTDGKIYVWGDRIGANGFTPRNLVRLNSDGSLDTTFSAKITNSFFFVWPQTNGKVLVTRGPGSGTDVGVWLLNDDGSTATNFNVGTGLSETGTGGTGISTVVAQLDGKFVLGGSFKNFNGQLRNSIVRLNPDGSIDKSFATGQGFTLRNFSGDRVPAYTSVYSLSNGRILVSDDLDQFNGQPVTGPVILNPDGSRDSTFDGTIPNGRSYVEHNYVLAVIDDQPIFFSDYGVGRLRMDLLLRIVSQSRDNAGTNHVTANALTGRIYTLQGSGTLATWDDLVTQPASTNRIQFTDTPTNAPGSYFYRVKQN